MGAVVRLHGLNELGFVAGLPEKFVIPFSLGRVVTTTTLFFATTRNAIVSRMFSVNRHFTRNRPLLHQQRVLPLLTTRKPNRVQNSFMDHTIQVTLCRVTYFNRTTIIVNRSFVGATSGEHVTFTVPQRNRPSKRITSLLWAFRVALRHIFRIVPSLSIQHGIRRSIIAHGRGLLFHRMRTTRPQHVTQHIGSLWVTTNRVGIISILSNHRQRVEIQQGNPNLIKGLNPSFFQ